MNKMELLISKIPPGLIENGYPGYDFYLFFLILKKNGYFAIYGVLLKNEKVKKEIEL